MDINLIKSMSETQIIGFCNKIIAEPTLWILWVGGILIYVLSLTAVLDFRRVNINKLLLAFFIYIIASFGLLYFLINSPHLIYKFIK